MPGFHDNFSTPHPNSDIPLYDGPLLLTVKGRTTEFAGKIGFHWFPSSDIRFMAERPVEAADGHLMLASNADGEYRVQIPGTSESVAFFPSNSTIHSGGMVHFEGSPREPLTLVNSGPMAYVEGFVVNLDEFWPPQRHDSWTWQSDEWRVTFSPVDDLSDVIKAVRRAGGYVFTHRVRFERVDGALFEVAAAEQVLHGLYRFLSFLQGRQVNVILPVGYDAAGTAVWRKWLSWNVGRWQGINHWSDTHETADLCEAFAGFMRLWTNPNWQDAIDAAIHWYVDSNRNASVLEAGTVFNQMALERLAWEFFVINGKAMSRDGFNRLTAADRIRLMLAHHQVPLELPPALPDAARWSREFNWTDIADAIAAMRNIVVHPEHKLRDRLDDGPASPLKDVWHCGLWALELLLLRLFGYTGGYQDRRKRPRYAGQPDPVPWATVPMKQ